MHELSVTENILSICMAHASAHQATQVTDVHVVIGQLSSVLDDSVQFYWDFLTENTICVQSKLHFRRIPARFCCLGCQNEYPLTDLMTPCPNCGSIHTKIVTGEEFYVESIEIEK